jgi:GTP pyrophosphokinase
MNDLPSTSYLDRNVVLKILSALQPLLDTELIGRAFDASTKAHGNQFRRSGEPYLNHPVEVAKILAELHLGSATVAAALLHDVVEDSSITLDEIKASFGEEIAFLVDGVTQITGIQLLNKEQRQAETLRKMLLSMAKDLRVILIKFADRLHNLRTLQFLTSEQIKKIATESMEIYAPLAHRLGMAAIKSEMEDLSFKYLYPKEYQALAGKLKETKQERERYLEEVAIPLRIRLKEQGIKAEVYGRSKHFYSIYRKMVNRNVPFDEIYDLFALRVVVPSVKDCYQAFGIIHSFWNPVFSRFKDYIASPKSNMYQSLHTTVVDNTGKLLEIQIRTIEMHKTAQAGIAAHFHYKEGSRFSASDEHLTWLSHIEEWQKELSDSNEFMEFLKIDLFPAEIFVFTPKGDITQLPKGATAMDFAFSIHTDLGIHCIGCKINSKVMPVDTPLKSGETVEILRSENQHPSPEWIRYVHTSRAKSALRRWLNQEGSVQSRDLGNEILSAEHQKLQIETPYKEWLELAAKSQKIVTVDLMLEMVGKGNLPVFQILHQLPADQFKKSSVPMMRRLVNKMMGSPASSPIRIADNENLMIRFGRCCMPVPGEKIIGFITKGRGVAVHRMNCPNALMLATNKERRVEVEWNTDEKNHFKVRLEVIAKNRMHLLSEMTHAISQFNSNILNAHILTKQEVVQDVFIIEVVHLRQLKKIIASLKAIKGIQKIIRGRLQDEEPPKPEAPL